MNKIGKIYKLLTVSLCIFTDFLQADQPDHGICCENSQGEFFAAGEFLYWKPHVSCLELDFGSGTISQINTGEAQLINSKEYDVDPSGQWNAGYRASIGYRFADPGLEVEAKWTDFQGDAKRSSRENSSILNEGKYRVRLEQVDCLIAYRSALNSCITAKPFLGVRGARIHQDIHARITTNIDLASDTTLLEARTLNDKQVYYGIGPLLGLEANWDFGCGWGLYGTAAAGLMYGRFKVHFDDSDYFTAPISKYIHSINKRHLHAFDCNIDLALGFYWRTCFDCAEVTMKVAFEHHEYFNQNRMGVSRGDLSFDGGVFSVFVGF